MRGCVCTHKHNILHLYNFKMDTLKYRKLVVCELSSDIKKAGKVVETEFRPPAKDEIVIRNHFAGVNATDMNILTGRSIFSTGGVPFDIGLEGMGTIYKLGENVDKEKFSIGTSGLVFANPPMAYAEYLYIKPEQFYPVPKLDAHYLGLFNTGLTATLGLDKCGQIKKGETVLITAAAGGTGQIAVQWATLKGCHVIGLCSSEEKISFLKSIGCNRVINYKTELVDQILKQEYPKGIDVIWETIGGHTFEMLFEHLAIGGRIVIVGSIDSYKTTGFAQWHIDSLPSKLLNKSAAIIGFRFRHYSQHFQDYLNQLIKLYDEQTIKVKIDTKDGDGNTFKGVEGCIQAIEHLQSGRNIGKVVAII